MSLNNFVKDYLNFSRKERIGIIILLSLILVVFFLPSFKSLLTTRKPLANDTAWTQAMKKLEKSKESQTDTNDSNTSVVSDEKNNYEYDRTVNKTSSLFYFDPNSISQKEWKQLGLRDKTIQTIQKYISKGGKFRKPEDLQKVYGLKQDDYDRLAPYIKIENENPHTEKLSFEEKKEEKFVSSRPHYNAVDINNADTTAFIALPGIGSKLALRIISFREKLGGFYTVEQIKEVYGLQDSVFQKLKTYLKLENKTLKKININTATKDELKAHPYIKWNIANAIIEYKNQHGNFTNPEDLKKIQAISQESFDKLINYITL
ncbi:MAG: helix-hairpin-helix domain-containing protein [Bacteroidota bacterium]